MGKTECVLFGTGKRLKKVGEFNVTCDGSSVQRVTTVKYLGVLLNANMNGRAQAENVVKTCAARLSFLYRKAAFLDFTCRKILTSALIQPYIDYCASSWYTGVAKQLRDKLDVIQRRMVRFVFSMGPMDHVDTRELKRLSWLNITDRVRYFSLIHVFKIRSGLAPDYLGEHFKPLSAAHSYNTRGHLHNYFVSKEISNAPSSFAYNAIKFWNALPLDIKELQSLPIFKKRLKSHLMSEY